MDYWLLVRMALRRMWPFVLLAEIRVGSLVYCIYGFAAKFPKSWWTCSFRRDMSHVWGLDRLRASQSYKRLLLLLSLWFGSS